MTTRVVAAVIEQDGKILLCQRPAHKRHGKLWEFPGGKIEPEESDFESIARELDEELGVEVLEVSPSTFSVADPGSIFVIEFFPVAIQGEPQCIEHMALEWASESDLLSFALAPSDLRYVHHRLRYQTTSAK